MSYTNGLDKPSEYFNTKLYTGSGSTQSITGVGFQPDWIWFKNRTDARAHALVDFIRGTNKVLRSDSNVAEATTTAGRDFESFDSDGFTVNNPLAFNSFNESGDNIVAWNWLASNTTASNTDGSITSTVSANTTSGFSIVTYTGAGSTQTIGHGLGATPGLVIVKRRTGGTNGWITWHNALTGLQYLILDSTTATASSSTIWNSTIPTSSVFSVGTSTAMNASGSTYVAYCFAPKSGYSSMGQYTGNGSTDGTFVYTGFKPAFVIVKRTNTTGSWMMFDNKRNTFNPEDKFLYSDLSNAEGTLTALDFVSNGFKFRNADTFWNASGSTYIFMAFAESPFTTSTGVPITAR